MTTDPATLTTPARSTLDAGALDQLFRTAHTAYAWADRPVPDTKLQEIYDLLKWAPTSANTSPARFVFIRTLEGKEKLRPALSAGNVERTMRAPVTCIVATDERFFDELPKLYPGVDAASWFAGNDVLARDTAARNGTLQGAYLILAARAVGLDVGPMSGFDNARVDDVFFVGTNWKSNFLVNLGHADPAGQQPRAPRLYFDEACRLE